jgi:hypothetical protein
MTTDETYHLSEIQLLEFHCGESESQEKFLITQHLNTCQSCARELENLKRDLGLIIETFPNEPDKVFWASFLSRLKMRMERPYSGKRGLFQQGSTIFATAMVTALLIIFIAGGFLTKTVPLYYEEWVSANLYSPANTKTDADAFNYALAQMADFDYQDVSPASEQEVIELLDKLSSTEVEKIFEEIKNEKIF